MEQHMTPESGASAVVPIAKMGTAGFFATLAYMTPLQWVQLIAGIAAIVYSVVQTYFLIRDRLKS